MDTVTWPRPTSAPAAAAAEQPPTATSPGPSSAGVPPTQRPTGPRAVLSGWWRGSESDPVWARPALVGLLLLTAVLYFWNLTANGYANSFYSAAAQAGSESWKAFFYGSF
ncbi:MAG: glycosyl transferase, partial [Actinomycetota bacterium]|nr:glycosyl transferase [Actinomycetota bacterium]